MASHCHWKKNTRYYLLPCRFRQIIKLQGLSVARVTAPTQNQIALGVPSSVGLLCRPISREGSNTHRARCRWPIEVLAQDTLAKRESRVIFVTVLFLLYRGDVSQWVGGDFGRDWTLGIFKNHDPTVQSTRQMRLIPSFPGFQPNFLYFTGTNVSQVAERALYYWNNEYFISLVQDHTQVTNFCFGMNYNVTV